MTKHRLSDVQRRVTMIEIPIGVWDGTWSGYVVTFDIDGVLYGARTELGIRGSAPVKVHVTEDGIWMPVGESK